MASDSLDKLKSNLNKGITTLNLKTSAVLEKTKIKTHISTLTTEIEQHESSLGKRIYEAWDNDRFRLEDFLEELQTIRKKHGRIQTLHQEYDQVDEKERTVLGSAGATESVHVCGSCGTSYDAPVKFCPKCGAKMS